VVLAVRLFNILSCSFQKDYRLIVPNIRGFGASTHPGDVQTSGSISDLVGDMMCILRHAGVSQAIAIGQAVFRMVRIR
jgi:pimeloyl-ACP methyl ester carboxylesterase